MNRNNSSKSTGLDVDLFMGVVAVVALVVLFVGALSGMIPL